MRTLYQHSSSNPEPRSNCAVASDGKDIYMFGGCVGDIRRNDFWKFNLDSNTWSVIHPT